MTRNLADPPTRVKNFLANSKKLRIDFLKTAILKVGSGRVGSVIWSVGGSVIFEVKFHEKNLENDSYH